SSARVCRTAARGAQLARTHGALDGDFLGTVGVGRRAVRAAFEGRRGGAALVERVVFRGGCWGRRLPKRLLVRARQVVAPRVDIPRPRTSVSRRRTGWYATRRQEVGRR